jgi:hypothetical protein
MKSGSHYGKLMIAGTAGMALLMACMNPTDTSKSAGDETIALRADGDSSKDAKDSDHGKTTICHMPPGNPENDHTLSVGNAAVAAHLAHGDKLGSCEEQKPVKPCPDTDPGVALSRKVWGFKINRHKLTICHIPPGNPGNAHTITVGLPAVKAHLAHGDKLGACNDPNPVPTDCGGGSNSTGTGNEPSNDT